MLGLSGGKVTIDLALFFAFIDEDPVFNEDEGCCTSEEDVELDESEGEEIN